MKMIFNLSNQLMMLATFAVLAFTSQSCQEVHNEVKKTVVASETPEYFLLRPKVEKEYGYSHAVKIGNDLKISGAVSMDDNGVLVAPGNLEQQMKNCYSDLDKILKHYGYTFDDVVAENVYTTNMAEFIKVSTYRNSIYKKQFPTGTWLEVKGLALPGQLIEIDMEAHKSE
jgi:enamine deaminase RidA (YjgF/YER057c/UK114 family)